MINNTKDVVEILIKRLKEKEIRYILSLTEDELIVLHNSLGRDIRNIFKLWDNKELLEDCLRLQKEEYPSDYKYCQKFYRQENIKLPYPIHPDDASNIILKELQRTIKKIIH